MKATRFANRAWAFVLAVLMTLTLIAPQALAANTVDPVEPASGKILVSQTDYTLIDGVTESDIFLNTKEGNAQIAGFMTTIAPGAKATFKASYNGYYTEGSTPASRKDKAANLAWSMEKTTLQAANYTKATGGNVIMAMNFGGDDFIAKPFDGGVLMAKVQAMLRRSYRLETALPAPECRGAVLNTADQTLQYEGNAIDLTKNEYRILLCLMERKGQVVSRELLMQRLWETDSFVDENTLTVNVNRLRKKLEAAGLSEFIRTRFGVGYLVE